jgi:hypothetical protein
MPPLPCVSARLETILGLGRIAHDAADHCPIPIHINLWVARFKRGSLFPTHLYPQAPALYRIAGPEATPARIPRTIRL